MKQLIRCLLFLSLCGSLSIHARHRGSCHRRSSYRGSCCSRYYPVPFFYPYGPSYWEPLGFGGGYFPGYYPGFYSGLGYYGPRFGFGFSFGL
jgi:hypothetical protein